ncbi:MAG: hypothetical protein F4X59_18130 [Holophagales bacterium]|nr:hypothetical protein [Holophagales bacterium]MYC12025.1 hypothetical protein [Holophagales bacterium]
MSQETASREAGAGPVRLVCRDVDGRHLAVDPLPAGSTVRSLSDLATDRDLSLCWSWSDVCPPRRHTDDDGPVPGGECDRTRPLEVRIFPQAEGEWFGSVEGPGEVLVTAAPVEMWSEVPRRLLPTVAAVSPVLSVSRGDGAWRLQGQAGDHASSWQSVAADQDAVELVLEPAADFRFELTADGAALADARFYLVEPASVHRPQAELLGFEVSDAEGIVAVTLPAAERSAVILTHDTRAAQPFPKPESLSPRIELGPGLTVSGYATNDAGEPVGGVRLQGLSFIPGGFGLLQRHRGRTGPDGRFDLSGFSPGSASLQTEDESLEFARTFSLEESADLGAIVLRPREAAWLQVVDARDGAAISGTRIRDSSGNWKTAPEDGPARLSLAFGREVAIRATGYLVSRFDLPGGVGLTAEEPFVVRLVPALAVEGVFVAPDGRTPATGGRVSATRRVEGARSGSRIRQSFIHPDGSFSIDLPAGAWDLELTAGNAGVLRLEIQGAEGETRNLGVISAQPSVWISGQVLDEDDYTPVADASISYTRPSEFGPLMAAVLGEVAMVATDAEGRFELFGLEAGMVTIRVRADGYAARKLEIEAQADQGLDVGVVPLSRGRRVTVRSDAGEGVAVLDAGGTGLPEDRLVAELADGSATFTAVPDGPFGVQVHEDDQPVCERRVDEDRGDEVVICDRSAARVTGLVSSGGRPGAGMLVWRRRAEAIFPEGFNRRGVGPFTRTEVVSSTQTLELNAPLGSDGRYSLPAVLPGEWEVIWAPVSGGAQDARSVTVPEAREAVLDFRYDDISVVGLVLGPDGEPVAFAGVTVLPSRRRVSTGRDGRFNVLGLAPGTHRLRAQRQHLRSAPVEVELRHATDREVVQLQLEEDLSEEELVISIRGGGSGFCFVETESALQKVVRVEAGLAKVVPDEPVSEKVRIACHMEGRWILDGWRDHRQALERGVEFDPFESDASLLLVAEQPPGPVEIIGPGGWDLGRLRSWFDGASTFAAGETVSNLPVGEYVLRWGDRTRIVYTQRRRTAEVELDF